MFMLKKLETCTVGEFRRQFTTLVVYPMAMLSCQVGVMTYLPLCTGDFHQRTLV